MKNRKNKRSSHRQTDSSHRQTDNVEDFYDPAKARSHFQQGAVLGEPACQVSYAFMCWKGFGGPQYIPHVYKYFKAAYDNGNLHAITQLGLLHLEGTLPEIPQNIDLGIKFLKEGADKGDTTPMVILAKMNLYGLYSAPINYQDGVLWALRSIVFENLEGMELMARIYLSGKCGVTQNYHSAILLFLKCIQPRIPSFIINIFDTQFDPISLCNNIGFMLAKGLGAPKDVPMAINYFKKATETPFPCGSALINLGLLYHSGVGVDVNLREAENYYKKALKTNVILPSILELGLETGLSPLSKELALEFLCASDLPNSPENSFPSNGMLRRKYNCERA
jgi:TPR repeat protein